MHKYNDGLDNETVRQVITTYRKPYSQQTVDIISNLGTEVVEKNLNSNYNSNLNVNENMNMNTFRQIENDCAPEAHLVPEKPLVAERPENNVLAFGGVMAAQPKTQPSKKGFKRLNTQAIYNEINVQVSNIRDMGRYMRCRIHVSLKEDIDRSYSVFLSGAATSSKYELIAGAKDNEQVLSVINNFMTRQPGCMIARFHYKPVKGFITDFHKKNLKLEGIGILFLFGKLDTRVVILSDDITSKLFLEESLGILDSIVDDHGVNVFHEFAECLDALIGFNSLE